MITSTANPQVRNIIQLMNKAKVRREQGVFLAEGIRIFTEVPKNMRQSVFVSEDFFQKEENRNLLENIDYELVSDHVFRHMSGTQTPQGILCIVRQPNYTLADLLRKRQTHLLVLEGIQDPGNLGTMFRTGEGAGVTGIIMGRDCVDIFAPKTVRATMGSIYRVPFYIADHLHETIAALKQRKITVYAAHLKGMDFYDAHDYQGGTAFLIGNEGNGLTDETAALADVYLRIPMEGQLESLNAAMAAGILMYEVSRQRRKV